MLSGKYALVTGANRGIGRAIVESFAQNGANIIANSRTEGSLEDLCGELSEKHGVLAVPIYFDVSQADQVKQGFQKIIKITRQVDVVVNNAGVRDNVLLGMVSADIIKEVFGVNIFGTLYVMQYAARLMMGKKRGSIINISSIVGVKGNSGQVVYSGSKAAIIGITRSAAKELAPYNIRVNAIAPGLIATDMIKTLSKEKYEETLNSIKMNRIGTPRDVANCALFLASDLAEYVTGQVLGVDGGMLM